MRNWTTRRGVAALVAGVAAMAGVAGCGGSDSDNSSSGSGGGESGAGLKAGESFDVGYAASQTGFLAIFEQSLIKGLKTEVDAINNKGGIDGKVKIKLTIRDAKTDPSTGGVVAQELISNGAKLLIAPCDADISLPAAQLAQTSKVPVINSCGSASSFPAQVGDYAFLNTYGTEIEGRAMADLAKQDGHKTAYIMTSSDNEYTDSMMKAATKGFEEIGGVKLLGTEQFKLDQPRFTAQATKIASANPDVVLTSMFLPGSVAFLKNLRAAGYDGPVIGPDGQSAPETFSAGSAAEGLTVMSFSYPSDDPTGKVTQEFYDRYQEANGEEANAISTLGGDLACLIDYAVKTANSTDSTKVRDALTNAEDVACPSSPISYKGRSGLPKKDVVVLKADPANKKFTFVKRFFPESDGSS